MGYHHFWKHPYKWVHVQHHDRSSMKLSNPAWLQRWSPLLGQSNGALTWHNMRFATQKRKKKTKMTMENGPCHFEDVSMYLLYIIIMVIFQLAILVFRGCSFYLVCFIPPNPTAPWHTYGGESLQENLPKELLEPWRFGPWISFPQGHRNLNMSTIQLMLSAEDLKLEVQLEILWIYQRTELCILRSYTSNIIQPCHPQLLAKPPTNPFFGPHDWRVCPL